ncbi:MAG: cytochrome c oxidase subunit 4, partial [Actinobacteria bacterium]|nr:cytochrome c oxidase subunit 4 [Actinomycetota bacterium]
WMTASPPKEHNFDNIPTVHALDEFFHRKYEEVEGPGGVTLVQVKTAEQVHAELEAGADSHIHLPSPSYWPIVLAFGLPVIAYGVIFDRTLSIVGALIVLLGSFGWVLEPSVADASDYDPDPIDGDLHENDSTKELASGG